MNSRFVPYMAAGGGLAWAIAFLGGASSDAGWAIPAVLLAFTMLLVAHAGLLRTGWTFLPAVGGAVLFVAGMVLSGLTDVVIFGLAGWDLMWMGLLAFVTAEAVTAARAFASASAPRAATAGIGLGAALQAIGLVGMMTGFLTTPVLAIAGVPLFTAGWVWLGLAPLLRRSPAASI